MMAGYRKYIYHLLFLLITPGLAAQILDPIDWQFSQEQVGENEVDLVFTAVIEDNWHLYSQELPEGGPIATSFTFTESGSFERSGEVLEVTEGEVKFDPSFGIDLKMFSQEAVFKQRIKILSAEEFVVSGSIEYMCCDDERCLPPKLEEFTFTISGEETPGSAQSGLQQAEMTLGLSDEVVITEDSGTSDRSLWVFFFIAFLAGLAGILTPCVFPMIPMTVSFFMQGSENRGKAIIKGLIFGISIIAIYTAIGVIVSLSSAGSGFTNVLSTHWIPNLIFFILFMVFAASFLGMFEIILPNSWVSRSDRQVDKGGYLGSFFMALTLVLVSFSCTGPIVGALLVEAAGGLAIKPILGMFGFSLAFALPFTLFAIFPAWLKGMPKSGGWLNSVKVVLGFIVLAFGMKFFSIIDQVYHLNILSRDVFLAIWIVIFTLLGLYLLGKLKLAHDSDLPHIKVPRLLLAIASFAFVVYMIPGLFGADLNGIAALIPPKSAQKFTLTLQTEAETGFPSGSTVSGDLCDIPKYGDILHLPHGLEGYYDYEQGMACARQMNKPVLLDFKGHACSNCKEMEAKVWSRPEVLKRLREKYIIIALYTDDRTKLPESEWITSTFDGKVKKTLGSKNLDIQITRFNTNTQPYYALVDPDGNPLAAPRGHNLDATAFLEWLESGLIQFRN
jgi:thiol:disulfide interchange protein DsbD